MKSPDNVEFCDCFCPAFTGSAKSLFQRHGIGASSACFTSKRAKTATCHADVSGIGVSVHIEVGSTTVQLLSDIMRQVTASQEVIRAEEREAIVKRQAFAGKNLLGNGLQSSVFNSQIVWDHELCFSLWIMDDVRPNLMLPALRAYCKFRSFYGTASLSYPHDYCRVTSKSADPAVSGGEAGVKTDRGRLLGKGRR